MVSKNERWPDLGATDWSATRTALHLYLQVVGKYKLARTPWLNHSWHATLRVTARGLTTMLLDDDGLGVEVIFDLSADHVVVETSAGARETVPLDETSVASFHQAFRHALRTVGANDRFHGTPNEIPDPVPFAEDRAARPHDGDAVRRLHRALVSANAVMERFRTGFIGKSSPVHLFWGSFDLAVTRFSGRPAPLHPGGIPALPDEVTREAYSHEVASAGFWPGGGPVEDAAFYAYAYPTPDGFAAAKMSVSDAYFHEGAGEFILPYAAVAGAQDPEGTLLAFLSNTFDAAADLAGWDRDRLICDIGAPLVPRAL